MKSSFPSLTERAEVVKRSGAHRPPVPAGKAGVTVPTLLFTFPAGTELIDSRSPGRAPPAGAALGGSCVKCC